MAGMSVDEFIADEVWLPLDPIPSARYRNSILWYEGLLAAHKQPEVVCTHGEVKNLRDLRRYCMKQEVRAGLRPVRRASVDGATPPTS